MSQDIYNSLTKFGITPEQYEGGSYDGQYFHLAVPQMLNELFGFDKDDKRKHSDYDPLHRAGLQDKHMREDPNF